MTDYENLMDEFAEAQKLTFSERHKARAALKSAIEALAAENERLNKNNGLIYTEVLQLRNERDALQAKLNAMGKGEPVGFMSPQQLELIKDPEDESGHYIPLRKTAAGNFVMALYAAPKALAPLTDKQLFANDDLLTINAHHIGDFNIVRKITRAVEAAHGIGGTP